jgi:lysophospholipase L1-like esterase
MAASALVGLRTYPDSAGSCDGGVKQFDFTAPSDVGLRQAVSGLVPNGGTPTAPALRAAADDLIQAGLTDGSTIILVSDGLSNCGGDPCEVARAIATEGLAIVNTVGFQISDEGQAELDCVAAATGGQSFNADDAEELRKAIEDASTPRLTMTITAPEPASTIPPGSIVIITAVVANESRQRADHVRALLRFQRDSGNLDPGVPGPLRSLGNLAAGQKQTLQWQYRASSDMANRRSMFAITAVGSNASPARATRSLSYSGDVSVDTAGSLLGDADSHVVIVGDSFSSGEGAGDYLAGTDDPLGNRCHRSPHTYAMKLGYHKTPTVLACSGAVTTDIYGETEQRGEDQSQVDKLRSLADPADVVLMTIGGNDVGFEPVIKTCFWHSHCQQQININPAVSGACVKKYHDAGAQLEYARQLYVGVVDANRFPKIDGCAPYIADFRTRSEAVIGGIGANLLTTYRLVDAAVNGPFDRLRRTGTVAPIVVLAYPSLVPRSTDGRGSCSLNLSDDELQFGEEFTRLLNERIAATVAEARAEGLPIFFASDVEDALRPNHTLCDRDPHANKLSLGNAVGHYQVPNQEMMHPTAAGYTDMTAALVRWSNRPEIRDAKVERHVFELPVLSVPTPVLAAATVGLSSAPTESSATLLQGEAVTLQGGGYAPGAMVTFTVQSIPRYVGSADADASGAITGIATLPRDLPLGLHTIVATGFGPDGRLHTQLTLIDVRDPFPLALAVAASLSVILLLIGAIGLWRTRGQLGVRPRRG